MKCIHVQLEWIQWILPGSSDQYPNYANYVKLYKVSRGLVPCRPYIPVRLICLDLILVVLIYIGLYKFPPD